MSGHPGFASLARLPDRSTPCRPASAKASSRAAGSPSNAFPSGLLPSRIGMAKPTIQQARDPAEVLWALHPRNGSRAPVPKNSVSRRPKRGSRMSAQGHDCGSRARSSNFRNWSISAARIPMIGWLLLAPLRHADRPCGCPLFGEDRNWPARGQSEATDAQRTLGGESRSRTLARSPA